MAKTGTCLSRTAGDSELHQQVHQIMPSKGQETHFPRPMKKGDRTSQKQNGFMDLAASWVVGGCAPAEDEAKDGTDLSLTMFSDPPVLGRGNNSTDSKSQWRHCYMSALEGIPRKEGVESASRIVFRPIISKMRGSSRWSHTHLVVLLKFAFWGAFDWI